MKRGRLIHAFVLLGVTGSVVAFSLSCGGGSPSSTTPVTTLATPTPPPNNGGVQYSCKLGYGTMNTSCGEATARLHGNVVAAIDTLVKQKPQIFDFTDVAYGEPKVVDRDAYLDGIVLNLQAQGLCAERDYEDYLYERVLVKSENAFSEVYDVISGTGYVRQNPGSYTSTCTPASFPVDRSVVNIPPAGSGCGRPYPPPVTRFRIWVHLQGNDIDVLDTTPLIGPDQQYCATIGYTDGRSMCPVRIENSPERVACETWAVGTAEDTGRPGPTWRNERGQFCTGGASNCENHPENQYALNVYKPGTYASCARNGACGSYVIR